MSTNFWTIPQQGVKTGGGVLSVIGGCSQCDRSREPASPAKPAEGNYKNAYIELKGESLLFILPSRVDVCRDYGTFLNQIQNLWKKMATVILNNDPYLKEKFGRLNSYQQECAVELLAHAISQKLGTKQLWELHDPPIFFCLFGHTDVPKNPINTLVTYGEAENLINKALASEAKAKLEGLSMIYEKTEEAERKQANASFPIVAHPGDELKISLVLNPQAFESRDKKTALKVNLPPRFVKISELAPQKDGRMEPITKDVEAYSLDFARSVLDESEEKAVMAVKAPGLPVIENTGLTISDLKLEEDGDKIKITAQIKIAENALRCGSKSRSLVITYADPEQYVIAKIEDGLRIEPVPIDPPSNLKVIGKGSTFCKLGWKAPAGAVKYKVYLEDEEVLTTSGTSATVSKLTPETSYILSVAAVDAKGNESEPAAVEYVTSAGGVVDPLKGLTSTVQP